ncbi:hemolymph lipopolysaccharide-binding protein-like isoform X2 [Schistocerca serialis cubense]|uniref:hemolymph lipopolysaccharide-binding protein-like isoform X2 n=1 Tax=Schistocerca serialis cubense TaxID=2023355 RepID=UPI00214E5403|nr:hemolymph lipopolysaccharide-binding protein-like isoform X2 [Schistocerca serialis cubense]
MVGSLRLLQLFQLFCTERASSRFCSEGDSATDLHHQDSMVWESTWQLLLTLFIVASPRELLADDCVSSSASSVSLSASSFRNLTGHWITKAALIRKSRRDVSDLLAEERPLHYDIDVTRQGCGDDETLTTFFSVVVCINELNGTHISVIKTPTDVQQPLQPDTTATTMPMFELISHTSPPPRVGADYKFFRNVGYYKLHTEKMNWENARRTCAKEGAHLAIVNSVAEENAIREVMRAHSSDNFAAFIGFHDIFKEGEYVTVLGEPLKSSGHVRWGKGEPNNGMFPGSPEGEDCGNIYADGAINDYRCTQELPFVCEQSL